MAWVTGIDVAGYTVVSEEITIADSAGANVVNTNTSTVPGDLSNRKVTYEVNITDESAADGDLSVSAQWSFDGSNWHTQVAGSTTVDTSATGLTAGTIDLTDIYAPYWRLTTATDGTDIQDSVTATISIVVGSTLRVKGI